LDVGLQLNGGTEGLVFATSRDAGVCVLTLGIPNSLGGEIEVLRKAGGCGYAMLLEFDFAAQAISIERLGSQLAEAPISVTEQIKIICGTLSLGWQQLESVDGLVTGAEKAQADWILTEWPKLDRPCPLPIVDLALAFASQRKAAYEPTKSYLVHGDAHIWNTLEAPDSPTGCKFVDPDGVVGERAMRWRWAWSAASYSAV